MGFSGGSVGKESACNAGDPGLIHVLGRSSVEGNGNLLQYSCLGNPMDREAWQATVRGVTGVGHNLAIKPPFNVYTLEANQTSISKHLLAIVLHHLCLDRNIQKFPDQYGNLVSVQPLESSMCVC